jgi:hypothetical protein
MAVDSVESDKWPTIESPARPARDRDYLRMDAFSKQFEVAIIDTQVR